MTDVNPPRKCPACGETHRGAFGPARLWCIEDTQLSCRYVIVKGWYCDRPFGDHEGMVFGTAIRRGPVADDGETTPVDINEPDCVYLVDKRVWPNKEREPYFKDRTFFPGD